MATVGNLFINVKARTAPFTKGMKSVRGTITRLAGGFVALAKKAALLGAAMGAIALGAMVLLTKKGLAAVDAMAKLAQNVGSSVESIQVLQHMATLGGVSVEKMDKSIAKMVKNIGESSMGIGTATDALKELGLNANELAKMRPEVMFGVLADAISNVGNRAKQGSLAYDIFGRAGQELLVTMDGGSAAVGKMSKKLRDLGVIIGDKQAQMVEKANDAWADIGLVWKGLGNQLAVEFAPMLTLIAKAIIEFVKSVGGMGKVAEFIVKAFFYAGAVMMDVIKAIHIGWLGLKAAVLQAGGEMAMAIAWSAQNIAESFQWMLIAAIKSSQGIATVMGFALDKWAEGMAEMGFETAAGFAKSGESLAKGIAIGLEDMATHELANKVESEFSKFMQEIGLNMQNEATGLGAELLDKIAEGWNLSKVGAGFESLKEKFMGEGFDFTGGTGEIDLNMPDMKGVVDTLDTAIGSMKVDAGGQERILDKTLKVDEKQLAVSKAMLAEIKSGSGVLT